MLSAVDTGTAGATGREIQSPHLTRRGLLLVVCLSGPLLAAAPRAVAAEQALTLADALAIALRSNLGLLAARGRHAVGVAGVGIASAWPNPELEADYTSSRPHPAFLFSQTIPFWAKRSAAIAVGRGELGLVDIGIDGVIQQLRHDVRVHYYGLLFALRAEEIGGLELRNDRELLELTQTRFRHGDVPELEVKQAGLGVGRAEASLKALSSDVGIARGELNLDLGRERDAPVALAGHLEERPALPDLAKLVERAMSEGREARELRQRVGVEESRLRLARTGWIPDLTAGAGAEFNDPEFSVGPQFRLGLSIPILYRKSAEQAQARAALEVLSREREALRQRLGTSLSSAFARVQAADGQVGLYVASLVPSAREVRELYRDSYREGTVGILNLVDALRSEREVQLGYARALFDFHRALADLEQQAGVELTDGPA
ncbi:MAG: TolC family protein [Deltaproteobacteria bacterium]|nr:MAG: TolC family protein [Deltaproteobacteria bacterium]